MRGACGKVTQVGGTSGKVDRWEGLVRGVDK